MCTGGAPVLHHFVAKADWLDDAVLSVMRAQVPPAVERQGPIRAWIVDDTGFPKGKHSVGLRGSIAANSASTTTARSRSVCRLPPARRACRSPISSICRKAGRTTLTGGKAGVSEHGIVPEIALTQSLTRNPGHARGGALVRRSMKRMEAMNIHAPALEMVVSKSLASRRQRPSQAKVRSVKRLYNVAWNRSFAW